MHWHRSCQYFTYRRTFVQVTREQVYYRDPPKCLDGGRFSARDTAWVWTNATPIEPLQHHSSQSCANLMSIQCQYTNSIPICQLHVNPIIISQSHANLPIHPSIDNLQNIIKITKPALLTPIRGNGLIQDWHPLAQITPILYQSEDICACNQGTSVLCGQATSLNSGRFQ